MQKPIVSVCMITYGHEKYIRQAIEGVLMQECNFEVELILANDCSPDSTDKVIQDILSNHSRRSWIKYFKHEENLGMMPNFIFALKKGEGKYVALCEGDDYWIDPLKLQKQVGFLEANPDYAICFHEVNILQDGIVKKDSLTFKVSETTTIKDLAKGNYIHTCSVVYKNNLFGQLPDYFRESPVGDYFLHLLNAHYGSIKRVNEIMGVYRVHGESYWSSKTQEEQELFWMPFLKKIMPNFNKEVQDVLKIQVASFKKNEQKKKLWNLRNIKNKIIQKIKKLISR